MQKLLLLCIKSLREHPDIDRFPSKQLIKNYGAICRALALWPWHWAGWNHASKKHYYSHSHRAPYSTRLPEGPGCRSPPWWEMYLNSGWEQIFPFWFLQVLLKKPLKDYLNNVWLVIIKESRLGSKFISIASQGTTCFATWASESRDL